VFHLYGFVKLGTIGLVIQSHPNNSTESVQPVGMCLVSFTNVDVWCYWEELEILNKYNNVR